MRITALWYMPVVPRSIGRDDSQTRNHTIVITCTLAGQLQPLCMNDCGALLRSP
jgi:hypothetical protein